MNVLIPEAIVRIMSKMELLLYFLIIVEMITFPISDPITEAISNLSVSAIL